MTDLHSRLDALVARLVADVAPTGLDLDRGVYDATRRTWLVGGSQAVPVGFEPEGYVLVLGGRQHVLPPGRDGAVDVVAVVEDVQEWVIDELGHGWPELVGPDGAFLGLLEPGPGHDDDVVWVTDARTVPLGRLSTVPVALPPRSPRTEP